MNQLKLENWLREWIEKQQSLGKHSFSLDLLGKELPHYTSIALKRGLSRLSLKGSIISIYKGYYLIIPPQYTSKGILPPSVYLDAFMRFLDRPYYLALLNAAAYHGATHQQAQEFFVVTNFPVLRATTKKDLKVNYISIKDIPVNFIDSRKTESGFLKISNPVLTATDLIQFEKRVGGINRVAAILSELADAIKPEGFTPELIKTTPTRALQRLGYLLEKVTGHIQLADALNNVMEKQKLNRFRIPLKASKPVKGFPTNERWNIIENINISIDE